MIKEHQQQIEKVEGLCSMPELAALYFTAAGFNRPGNHIVEVGSYKGKSTVALALGAPLATILAVDLWHTNADPRSEEYIKHETYDTFRRNTGRLPNVRHRVGNLEAQDFNPKPCMVFVDGDHRYPGVSANIKTILEHASPGTLVAFHDFAPGKSYGEGVFQAYLEHRSRFKTICQIERLLITELVA